MRRAAIAANWKMHKTVGEAADFVRAFLPLVAQTRDVDVILAPVYTALHAVGQALDGSSVALAAQNVNPEPRGAFTGEVSAALLADVGCRYAIVGHSERRTLYGETDELVGAKTEALLENGLLPIVCVGESLHEREGGRTLDVVGGQIRASLARIPKDRAAEIIVAYEPIWAIGTGKTATPEMAQAVHAMIRTELGSLFGPPGDAIRIQYGGSVKPDNVAELMTQPDIDGALVGGASLEPESFAKVVNFQGGAA